MRPIILCLSVCVLATCLHEMIYAPFRAQMTAAVAQETTGQSTLRSETRLQKLEHYAAASEILTKEKAAAEYLESQREPARNRLRFEVGFERATKEVQATWDRYGDDAKKLAWETAIQQMSPDKQAAALEQDAKNRTVITQIRETVEQELKDPNSPASKELAKKLEGSTWLKDLRLEKELVRRLTRERDETRAALLGD
jgi:hypothetical protein